MTSTWSPDQDLAVGSENCPEGYDRPAACETVSYSVFIKTRTTLPTPLKRCKLSQMFLSYADFY
jgi:hypothetical protein